jgi:hypothetical protein
VAENFISRLYGGLLRQEIVCKKCSHSSTIAEPFNVLSVPIDFEQDKSTYARIKLVYIYDTDRYRRFEVLIKPGSYTFKEFHEKIRSKIEGERREVKSGKRTFILADLTEEFTLLQKVFLEEQIMLTFAKGQDLKVFAYECPRGQVDKLLPINFLHITRDLIKPGERRYQTFPRLILFNEQDAVRSIC